MKKVNLSDQRGNVKTKYVGYSFGFLFFGPFYLIAKFRLITGIVLLLLYYYILPLPGMNIINDIMTSNMSENIATIVTRFLVFFRGEYARYVGIAFVILFQSILSIFMEGILLRKQIKKKKYLPITEDDARLLISIFACNRKIPLASSKIDASNYNSILEYSSNKKHVPYIINEVDNSNLISFKKQQKRHKIEELNDLYNLGQMTREEYEIRRAEIIKKYR